MSLVCFCPQATRFTTLPSSCSCNFMLITVALLLAPMCTYLAGAQIVAAVKASIGASPQLMSADQIAGESYCGKLAGVEAAAACGLCSAKCHGVAVSMTLCVG